MMKVNKMIALSLGILFFISCNNDDDGGTTIELRDVAEVAAEDDAELQEYLRTHFYNYEEFETPPADFNYKIVFDTIAGVNADKTPLIDQVETKVLDFNDVDHTLYYLVARDGVGESPALGHNVVVTYEGSLLSGEVFDNSNVEIVFSTLSVIRGYAELFPEMKTGTSFTENGDGTISWNQDFGIGAVFMPSGLGYFNNSGASGIIPSYSPLIFTTNLYAFEERDEDVIRTSNTTSVASPDGIPSHLEDPDGDGNPRNDDTDEDGIPNYQDADDDGDGILTEYEYDRNGDGIVDDSNGDGIPDYLDPEYPKIN